MSSREPLLVKKNRDPDDAASYPDVDLRWNAPDARDRYSHKDGRPY